MIVLCDSDESIEEEYEDTRIHRARESARERERARERKRAFTCTHHLYMCRRKVPC